MEKNACICFAILTAVLFLNLRPAMCLEKLSGEEMGKITGQAGISAAVSNGVIYIQSPSITIRDAGTTDRFGNPFAVNGRISYNSKALLGIDEAFAIDIGMPYDDELITVTDQIGSVSQERSFDHPLGEMGMIAFVQLSNEPFYTFSKQNIAVYNHGLDQMSQIGDLNFSDFQIFESMAGIFPPAGNSECGIRAVAGIKAQTGSILLENPDQDMSASFSGIMIGSAFTGDVLPESAGSTSQIDTSTWDFDQGLFELGIPYYYHDDPDTEDLEINTYPFSLDIASDENRPGDFQTYVAINAPIKGSIRIENISSSNFDMGPVAIDGIRLYKNVVEFPGRGIGN